MKKIGFVTGSRADYGIMRRYLEKLDNSENIELTIIVTGALLSEKYGRQVSLIYEDGFKNIKEISVGLNNSSNGQILHTMSEVMDKFGMYFEENKYDLIIILGDRYEMLSVATAVAMQQIPILHIHGGEATFGNYDEFIRHAITKMSRFHFTATDEYRNRVIQLGENPDLVFYVGALGAENCLFIDESVVPEAVKNLPEKKYYVVLFHPETLTKTSALDQVKTLLSAINGMQDYTYVFLGANADTHSDNIRRAVSDFVESHDNAIYFENLHTDAYHYLLKNAICLVGNSSSGIIEAPSMGIYTINIGDRQKGRTRGNSVIDIKCDTAEITGAMKKVQNMGEEPVFNPYYKENTAKEYYEKTLVILDNLEETTREPKVFYDLEF